MLAMIPSMKEAKEHRTRFFVKGVSCSIETPAKCSRFQFVERDENRKTKRKKERIFVQ